MFTTYEEGNISLTDLNDLDILLGLIGFGGTFTHEFKKKMTQNRVLRLVCLGTSETLLQRDLNIPTVV